MTSPGSVMASELRVFVYGTLKRGFPNHDAYCSGVLQVCPAWLPGKLFKLSPYDPVMTVPGEDILVYGTASVAVDIEAQEKFESLLKNKGTGGLASLGDTGWGKVRGELLIFNDSQTRLPLLDGFEEFRPGRPSTYIRVLMFVTLVGGLQTSAWTYITGSDPAGLEEYPGESWDCARC